MHSHGFVTELIFCTAHCLPVLPILFPLLLLFQFTLVLDNLLAPTKVLLAACPCVRSTGLMCGRVRTIGLGRIGLARAFCLGAPVLR